MSKKKEENKKVVFRRIGGRVVPIVLGGGAIAGARYISKNEDSITSSSYMKLAKKEKMPLLNGIKDKEKRMIQIRANQAQFNYIRRKFTKDLDKLGTDLIYNPLSEDNYFSYGGGRQPHIGNTHGITLNKPSVSTLIHEMGHAEQAKKRTRSFKARRRGLFFSYRLDLMSKKIGGKYISGKRFDKTFSRLEKLDKKLKPFVTFYNEVDAWRRGAKISKSKNIKRSLWKSSINPLRSYAVVPKIKASKYGLIAAGIGAIGYGLFKGEK